MYITYTQCKQIANNTDLRDFIAALNNQPEWITQELDIADIQSIQQGGCASGAYMLAVTYYDAMQTMNEHGDDVLDYIEQQYGDVLEVPQGTTWSGIAVFFLSMAVEIWANQFDLDGVNWD